MNREPLPKRSNKLALPRPEGAFQLRLYHRKGQGKRLPRYLVKCGCCDEKLEIYYDEQGLEINGVWGSIQDWREVLLPLLAEQAPADQ